MHLSFIMKFLTNLGMILPIIFLPQKHFFPSWEAFFGKILVLVIPQLYHSFFLIWGFILFLVLLRLFLNKLAEFFKVSRNPIPWLVLVETETGQSTGGCMTWLSPQKCLSIFIRVRKWVGSLLTSGLTFNFTQVKGRHASKSDLYILKKLSYSQTSLWS